ncbi:glycosyltransferase family 39 protein [Oryzomicrobium sp.]|uniref:glycosyltransferase family 39 protein n=1 Tax=Oryzomicrobium sp. TaxID=1911578 RepID=UPI0025F9DE45|nr:glycosyltransferase family 39 protein [Oryzomicrobium sp.]MCE1241995.1 glycosyltransferase family 39 protein [Oryzomicrobium sp.]
MPFSRSAPRRWPLTLVGLFLAALVVFGLGIQEPTGLTGKDEFFLGLRTPMEMMEKDAWLVPVLNDQPRLKKPPMLYWLGRASFETFGPSLPAARGITVLFAALLVAATAALGRRLAGSAGAGLWAALLLFTVLGLASESRRFMLDVPTASLSTLSFLFLVRWKDDRRARDLTLAAVLLAAGFLLKGPIVAVVCGAGVLGLLLSGQWPLADLWRRKFSVAGALGLFLALALPWFIYVRLRYPEAAAAELQEELEARQLFTPSPQTLLAALQIVMPWSFVLLALAWRLRREAGPARTLLLWAGLTVLPFCFIHTFDRYLVGSLVPFALILGFALDRGERFPAWALRLGAALVLLVAGVFAAFAFWFHLGGWGWLLPPLALVLWAAARAEPRWLAGAMALLWMTFFGLFFPHLQINAVPEPVRALAADRPVLMFDGPQPAMLPILLGRALSHTDTLQPRHLAPPRLLVFVRAEDEARLQEQARALGATLRPLGGYQALASRGSGVRFTRDGAGKAEWREALRSRSLQPLESTIRYLEVAAPATAGANSDAKTEAAR